MEVTYLQAFYFSLEPENKVLRVPAVQALLALLFGGRRPLLDLSLHDCSRFLVPDLVGLPLLQQIDLAVGATRLFIWIETNA